MDYITVKHFEIADFEAWGGAKDFIDLARKAHRLSEVQDAVEIAFSDYEPHEVTDSMINEFLWFVLPDDEQFEDLYTI